MAVGVVVGCGGWWQWQWVSVLHCWDSVLHCWDSVLQWLGFSNGGQWLGFFDNGGGWRWPWVIGWVFLFGRKDIHKERERKKERE